MWLGQAVFFMEDVERGGFLGEGVRRLGSGVRRLESVCKKQQNKLAIRLAW